MGLHLRTSAMGGRLASRQGRDHDASVMSICHEGLPVGRSLVVAPMDGTALHLLKPLTLHVARSHEARALYVAPVRRSLLASTSILPAR